MQGLATRGTTRADNETYKSKARPKKRKTITKAADGTQTTIIEEYKEAATPADNPDERIFTYEIKYSSIISRCPQIRYELEQIENNGGTNQAYNAKLKQTFTAAFRIFLTKTDAPIFYADLHFTNVNPATKEYILPTKSTLSTRYIGIAHKGKAKKSNQEPAE